jgi:broad specificity phosphatase PhoE
VGVILLVRHGQASFGSADYDVLSPLGERQSRCLGAALAGRGVRPASVVSGSMRRQRDSAVALTEQAGWNLEPSVDAGWNEFEHLGLAANRDAGHAPPDREAFQDVLEAGMRRWAGDGGAPPVAESVGESFADFTARTESALRAVAAAQPRGTTTVVATSGGVIGLITATLLGAGVEQWIRLNRVCVNTGVTTLVTGRQGISLVSFNEHSHLSPPEISYR